MPVEFEGGLGLALVLAFVGGMILNLMPCVLPVISFKVLSFVKMAGQSRKLVFTHGLTFTLGVLLSFWVLTAALLVLQAYGRSVGWGFQLQEPLFVAILAAILLVFGLSLFGVFEFGTSLIAMAGQAQQSATAKRSGLFGSFMSGILATAVATPCTGPFLGSAVGFAMTLPPALTMLVFTSLGLGMSLPYLLLATFPSTLRFLPKPGQWMVTFKELMGFFMLATVLWLVWVFGAQTSTFALFLLLAGFFFLALGSWVYGKWSMQRKTIRLIAYGLTIACFATGGYAIFNAVSPWAAQMDSSSATKQVANHSAADAWEEFSPERLAELQKQGTPVFIDFTAKWCLICQANHLVLTTSEVTQQFEKLGVVKMKADWTKNDPVITAELRKHGRSGVPLYLLYGTDPKAAPKILPQVLTPEIVLEELKNITPQHDVH
jgi:thiol:disulfide interchange protein DsbD